MPDYTGGYTGAINDLNTRRYRDIQMQQMLQGLTQRQMLFQEQEEDRRRAIMGAEKGVSTLVGMQPGAEGGPPPPLGAEAPPTPPGLSPPTLALFGPQPGPQAPMPGQASVPMQAAPPGPPPVAPMAPPIAPPTGPTSAQAAVDPQAQALARGLAKGGPMQVKVSPQGQITSTPPGWRPSPAAPPTLGGAPPAPAAPVGGPAVPPPPGGIPGGAPDLQQGKMIDPKDFLARAIKQGATPLAAYDQLKAMEPAIDAHNKQIINQFGEQAKIAKAVIDYQNMLLRAQREGRLAEAFTEREKRLQEREDRLSGRAGGAAPAKGGARGAPGPDTGLTPEGIELAAQEYRRTGKMPPLGFDAPSRRAIINAAARQQTAEGTGLGEVPGAQAEFHADSLALNAITKDLTAIRPFADMLDTNADILKGLAAKVSKVDARYVNKSLNWLGQNVTGNADVAEFLAQMRFVQTEAARVLNNPRLVGQLTDTARHEMEGVVDGSLSLDQTNRVIDRILADSKNRIGAMERQRNTLAAKLRSGTKAGATAPTPPAAGSPGEPPQTNAKGWKLMVDKNGNRAYVSPDRKQFEALP